MSMKLGASSGTYNVQASELARNKPVTKSVRCVVRFLDDSEAVFEIDVSTTDFLEWTFLYTVLGK